jgi:hypothetical protein
MNSAALETALKLSTLIEHIVPEPKTGIKCKALFHVVKVLNLPFTLSFDSRNVNGQLISKATAQNEPFPGFVGRGHFVLSCDLARDSMTLLD